MKKKPRKKAAPKPETPPTFVEAMRKIGWGEGDRSMKPEPGKDRYFITTRGQDDPNWEPLVEDRVRRKPARFQSRPSHAPT